MNTIIDLSRRWIFVAAMLPAMMLVPGCSNHDKDKPKTLTAEGIAKSIDLDRRSVSMTMMDSKGAEKEIVGTFRDDTEVMINGRIETIKDIKPGDKVVVQGYREGEGINQKLVATKVRIDRPQGSDWKPAGGAAAPTANKPAAKPKTTSK